MPLKIKQYFTEYIWQDDEEEPRVVDSDEETEVFDEESYHLEDSDQTIQEAMVNWAMDLLRDAGAYEASSSHYCPGIWYSSRRENENYETGSFSETTYHPQGPKKVLKMIFEAHLKWEKGGFRY